MKKKYICFKVNNQNNCKLLTDVNPNSLCFPGGSDSKESPSMWEIWVLSLGWKDSLEEGMATHCRILAWRIPMDQVAWWATSCEVAKSWT